MYCNLLKAIVYNAILKLFLNFLHIYSYCIKIIAYIKKKWCIAV